MRKLVWFSLGFGVACCLCAYVLTGSVRVILTVAGGVLTLLTAIAGRKYIWFRRVAAVFLGFAAGMGWFSLYDGLLPERCRDDGREDGRRSHPGVGLQL